MLHALKQNAAKTQKELAAVVEVEQPAMAELLGRMERDGLIRRRPDPADGRSSVVELNALAKRKIEPARTALRAGHKAALAGFTRREKEQLEGFLARIVENLAQEGG